MIRSEEEAEESRMHGERMLAQQEREMSVESYDEAQANDAFEEYVRQCHEEGLEPQYEEYE